ncbi:MAG: hypothetical protein WC414_03240 [Patescibacteria group bacterium]
MNISIIDIGTKSLKHYIFKIFDSDKELIHFQRFSEVNLGADAEMSPDTEERLLSTIKKCLDLNQELNVEKLNLVGTEFFRKSKQAEEIISKIKTLTGVDVVILDHEKEAFYLYNGFVGLLNIDDNFAATNIGGGSTEIIVGNNYNMVYSQKLDFGVNFLKKSFCDEKKDWDSLDEFLEKNITKYDNNIKKFFITGVLDFLSIVAPKLGFKFIDSSLPGHPFELDINTYRFLVEKLRETEIDKLRSFYEKDPDFANNVAIGQSVYLKVAEKLGVDYIVPSNNDLTDGIINEMV